MDLSLSSRIANGYGSNNGANCYASVNQGAQSVSGNYTDINYSMSATYFCNAGWTWGGTSRYNNGYFDLLINGNTVATINLNTVAGWGNGTSIGSKSGTYRVTHNSDGTKSVSVQIRVNSGVDPQGGGVYYQAASGGAQTLTLTTIPRTSNVSLNTNTLECNGSNRFTIYTNRKSTSFTHTITYGFGSASGTIATGVGDSCTWTPSKSLLSQIPSAQSGWGRITCTTYSGSTQIGQSSVDFTLTVGSTSKPVITSFTITEQTSIVSQKVGANATMALLSNKLVRVTEHTVDGATTTSVFITNNGKRVQLQQTGMQGGDAVLTGYISAVTSGTYTVTVNDTRGLSASTTISQTFYNYTYPTIAATNFSRTIATGSDGTLTANGTYANILSNTVTIQVTRTGLSQVTIAGSKSNGSWSFSQSYSDLTYTSSFTATIRITDSFGQVAQLNVVLGRSQPVLWLGETKVEVGGPIRLDGGIDPIQLEEGKDFNSYTTPGFYMSGLNATVESMPHHPVATSGNLIVIPDAGTTQIFIPYKEYNTSFYIRSYYGWPPETAAWSPWRKYGSTLDMYPVGSIYMSVNSTNPANLFGGTWVEIQGRFLFGRDGSHAAGSTGGEAAHTLSQTELPVIQGNLQFRNIGGANTVDLYPGGQTFGTSGPFTYSRNGGSKWSLQGYGENSVANNSRIDFKIGDGKSHNNMPPYLSVYMWKRTA